MQKRHATILGATFLVFATLAVGFTIGHKVGDERTHELEEEMFEMGRDDMYAELVAQGDLPTEDQIRQVRAEEAFEWHGAASNVAAAIGDDQCTVYEDMSWTCSDGRSGSRLTDLLEGREANHGREK